jgi:hypothetical protein
MAALVAVDTHRHGRESIIEPHALSAYLLNRERAHWHALHARIEDRRPTSPEMMGRAVYVATLTGPLRHSDARHALGRANVTEPGVDTVIDDHRFCYPPQDPDTVLQGLHPDRLGEDLIALTTPGYPHAGDDGWTPDPWATNAAHALLTTDHPPAVWTSTAVTVLVETAHRWPHIATNVLYPVLRNHPGLAITAGGATLTHLADLPDIDPAVLEAIEALLPDDRHIDLDIAAAVITTTLTSHRLATTTDAAQHAHLHANHARRLISTGRHDQALPPAEQASDIYRQLAETNPAYLPGLATTSTTECAPTIRFRPAGTAGPVRGPGGSAI